MFALSLSWNTNKFKSVRKQIEEIARAGFKEVELNFSLTEKKVDQIQNLRRKGQIKITSCHNYCPIPCGLPVKKALPDCYSLSSLNEKNRRLAIKYTKRSIDTASKLKAKALILHTGRVDMPDASKQLMQLFAKGRKNCASFKDIKGLMRRQREKAKRPYLEKVYQSIKELSDYAECKNIKLGLENRIYYPEIPQLEEFAELLNQTGAFFWFDTGHAYIMQKLWSVKLDEYLKRYTHKLIGIHLHDVVGMQDHLAPGTGEFDFRILKPFIRRNTLMVIEAHAPATSKELMQGVRILNKTFN